MSLWLRRCALCVCLLSLPALAGPPREDRRSARIRNPHANPASRSEETEAPQVEPSEAAPLAAAAADPGGVDLAGLLGMVAALSATFVYARGRRLSPVRSPSQTSPVAGPPDPR
jgi:hypothetical protein